MGIKKCEQAYADSTREWRSLSSQAYYWCDRKWLKIENLD